MAPPPKPPIICYDLQTDSNARKSCLKRFGVPKTGSRKKVTVIRKEVHEIARNFPSPPPSSRPPSSILNKNNDSDYYAAHQSACCSTIHRLSPPPHAYKLPATKTDTILRNRQQPIIAVRQRHLQPLTDKISYQQPAPAASAHPPAHVQMSKARQYYSDFVKDESKLLVRKKQLQQARLEVRRELDQMSQDLDFARGWCQSLENNVGMSHNAAKYIAKQEEEYAKLREKINEYGEVRSHELERQVQIKKKQQRQQLIKERENDALRERNLLDLKKTRPKLRRSLEDVTNTSQSSSSNSSCIPETSAVFDNLSSSTIDISSCSSTGEQRYATAKEVTPLTRSGKVKSSHVCFREPLTNKMSPSISSSSSSSQASSGCASSQQLRARDNDEGSNEDKLKKYLSLEEKIQPLSNDSSLFEVTDIEFFNKVEDPTIMEVNRLLDECLRLKNDFKDHSLNFN